MKNKKKLVTIVLAVLCVASLMVGSLAVFTDRFMSQTTAKAGTLDIVLTTGTDNQGWGEENKALASVFRPGTALKLNYGLTNAGNMSADVKETFVITTDKALTAGALEFALYASGNVTVDASGNVTAISGAAMVPTKTGTYEKDSKTYYTYTYEPAMFTLNGTGENHQTATGGKDGYTNTYYLVFGTDVDNSFQKVSVGVEYLAQALQHENTGADTWTDNRVITEGVTIGGESIKVVPELK